MARKIVHVTSADLPAILLRKYGAQPVSFVARTVPDLAVTGNPFIDNIVKIATVSAFLFVNYAAAVGRRRMREAALRGEASDQAEAFQLSPRKWGQRVAGTCFVDHAKKDGVYGVYVEVKVERSLGYRYETLDGLRIPTDLVRPFVRERSGAAEGQGVEREVILREYSAQSILRLRYRRQTYAVTPSPVSVRPGLTAGIPVAKIVKRRSTARPVARLAQLVAVADRLEA